MTTYTLRTGSPDKTRTDLVVIGVLQKGAGTKAALVAAEGGQAVASAYGRRFAPMLTAMGFKGTHGEVLRLPTGGTLKASQLLVVGLGRDEDLTAEKVRRAAGVAARNVGNAASVSLALPASDAAHVRAVADGFRSGRYAYTEYKSGARESALAEVNVLSETARKQEAKDAFEASRIVGELVDISRDWVNAPPNEFTPVAFAEAVTTLTKNRKNGVTAEVYDLARLTELGCGGILGVGQGSSNEPRLVKLSWQPKKATTSVALVGKGITYDSGGLTIKPGGSMATMKCDMAGAAAVVAALHAIADLEIPVAVTAWVPMAENSISGNAMRPGDVLTIHGGTTVEITNTDAEGRLILADALTLAVEEKPDVIVDVATLTGACVVALGEKIAGLFGDEATVAALQPAIAASGEMFWPLPLPEHIAESVRNESKVADLLQSNWVRWGSALYAAAFLREFTGGLPWAHFDTAGPSYNSGAPWGHYPSGATGFATPTLVEFVAGLAD